MYYKINLINCLTMYFCNNSHCTYLNFIINTYPVPSLLFLGKFKLIKLQIKVRKRLFTNFHTMS